jgi:DNA-binding transcriptional regulator YiaG
MTNAPVPQASPKKVTAETARALGEAAGELITPKSIKAMTDTFQLQRLAHKDLSHLFEHVVMVSNRAPLELAKYYVLIRYAVGKEVARRYGIFEEQPQVKENSSLTDNSDFRKVPLDVKLPRSMQQMLEDVRRFTKAHGMKAALAKYLNVPQARVSEWLDGKYEPSGKTTLKMLHWVEQQELQK